MHGAVKLPGCQTQAPSLWLETLMAGSNGLKSGTERRSKNGKNGQNCKRMWLSICSACIQGMDGGFVWILRVLPQTDGKSSLGKRASKGGGVLMIDHHLSHCLIFHGLEIPPVRWQNPSIWESENLGWGKRPVTHTVGKSAQNCSGKNCKNENSHPPSSTKGLVEGETKLFVGKNQEGRNGVCVQGFGRLGVGNCRKKSMVKRASRENRERDVKSSNMGGVVVEGDGRASDPPV